MATITRRRSLQRTTAAAGGLAIPLTRGAGAAPAGGMTSAWHTNIAPRWCDWPAVFRHAFMNAIGPRIAATKWQDVLSSTLTTGYAYPWEEIKLKA